MNIKTRLPSPTLPKQRGSCIVDTVGFNIIRCLSLLFYPSSCFLHLCSSIPAAASSYSDYSQLSAHYFGYRIVLRKMEVQLVDSFVKVRCLLLLLPQVAMIGIVYPSDFVLIFRSCCTPRIILCRFLFLRPRILYLES